MPNEPDRPDIEAGASFRAKKLRFERVPDVEVRYAGDSESVSDRKNLPEEVEPGVTYRDVEVQWHSQARVAIQEMSEEIEKTQRREGR